MRGGATLPARGSHSPESAHTSAIHTWQNSAGAQLGDGTTSTTTSRQKRAAMVIWSPNLNTCRSLTPETPLNDVAGAHGPYVVTLLSHRYHVGSVKSRLSECPHFSFILFLHRESTAWHNSHCCLYLSDERTDTLVPRLKHWPCNG